MAGYHFVEHFDLDDGSLEGVDPRAAFAYGVEWETFRRKLAGGAKFRTLAFPANVKRLQALAQRWGRYSEPVGKTPSGMVDLFVGGCA